MKALRSSPARFFVLACALQSFIFCCCAACAALGCFVSCAMAGTAITASRANARTNEILRCSMGSPLRERIDLGSPGEAPHSAAILQRPAASQVNPFTKRTSHAATQDLVGSRIGPAGGYGRTRHGARHETAERGAGRAATENERLQCAGQNEEPRG